MNANELLDQYANGERNFGRADLSRANLGGANLFMADLGGANLREANLSRANLSGANLSGASGLLSQEEWLSQFERLPEGSFTHTHYPQPWVIEEGAVIEEVVEPNPTTLCGCGVNFGTLEFVRREFPDSEIRECILPPFAQVVVPYNTDGKARAAKLVIGKVVEL